MMLVVESDKADMDVESYEEGYLAAILTPESESAASMRRRHMDEVRRSERARRPRCVGMLPVRASERESQWTGCEADWMMGIVAACEARSYVQHFASTRCQRDGNLGVAAMSGGGAW